MCAPGYSNGIRNECAVGQQWLDDTLSSLLDWMTRCSAVGPQCRHTLALKKPFSKVTLHTTSRTETVLFKTDKKGLLRWIRIVIRWNVFMLSSDKVSNIVSEKGQNTMNNYNYIYIYIQGGSNMTGTDLYVNKPHCAAAVRPSESEATTSTLPPARVRTSSVLSGSC